MQTPFGKARSPSLETLLRRNAFHFLAFVLAIGLGQFGCTSQSQPATAGNRQIEYFMALQAGNFDTAYAWLCSSTRQTTSQLDFVRTRGQVLIPDWDPAINGMEGGTYERVSDPETERDDVTETEVEAILKSADTRTTWRIEMRKENGEWLLCSFKKVA